MTPSVALTLLGFGLGVLIVANRRTDPRADPHGELRAAMSLRDRAIEAQKISARASEVARDLAAQWNETNQ